MPSTIRKRAGTWHYDSNTSPVRIRRSLRTGNKKIAMHEKSVLDKLYREDEDWCRTEHTMPVKEAFAEYLELVAHMKTWQWTERVAQMLDNFTAWNKRNAKGHGYQLLRRHTKAVTKILLFGRVFIGKACMKNPVRTGYAVL